MSVVNVTSESHEFDSRPFTHALCESLGFEFFQIAFFTLPSWQYRPILAVQILLEELREVESFYLMALR